MPLEEPVASKQKVEPAWNRRRFCSSVFAGVAAANTGAWASAQVTGTIPGFPERTFLFGGQSHRVFHSEALGLGVILLHELPGLTAATKEFADWLVIQGFHVVMPLLFGEPLQNATLGSVVGPMVCIRREFNCFRKGVASPATDWLRALCLEVHAECKGPGVGVIGMCLTGGFVLTLMADESVMAPVAAEPSLPFLQPGSLDVDSQVLARAVSRANQAPLLGLRFAEDKLCPAERFDAISDAFCGPNVICPRFQEVVIPGKGHSTLTADYDKALNAGIDTRKRVLEHLRAALKPNTHL